MRKLKKLICILCTLCFILSIFSINVNANTYDTTTYDTSGNKVDVDALVHDGEKATGVGLAAWACVAYSEGWQYVYGGNCYGATDCSGLMMIYRGVTGNRIGCLDSAQANGRPWGYVSNGVPRIHVLGLHHPGHVGVYLGSYVQITKPQGCWGNFDVGIEKTGIFIDERDSDTGYHVMLDELAVGRWDEWYYVTDVEYPTTGFASFNGDVFYYEPTKGTGYSEYVVDCTRTVNGKKYTFGKDGVCKESVPSSEIKWSAKATPNKCFKTDGTKGSPGQIKNASGKVVSGTSGGNSSGSQSETTETETSSESSGSKGTKKHYSDFGEVSVEEVSRVEANRDLSFADERRVDDLNYRISSHRESETWNLIYIVVNFIGVVFLVYTILLVLVYYIDIFNSLTEVSLLHKLTFGRMYPVGSERNIEHLALKENKGIVYATHKTIWTTFVIGVLASAVLLNARTIVVDFIYLSNWFENLIKSVAGG